MSIRTLDYKKIALPGNSFALVRTNPALTGNVKLTVDEDGGVWMNSIDAMKELANDKYKKFAVDPGYSHSVNVMRFLDNGKTPPDITFSVAREVDPLRISNDYKDQYDFSLYGSGVRYLVNKSYDERFSYFAPIYLKGEIPEYFVIFRINGPVNKRIDKLTRDYMFDTKNYVYDMFDGADIVKTFDLRMNSKVGSYIRKMMSDPNFPREPMSVDFGDDSFTYWNGISVTSGTYSSKGELLGDFYRDDYPLKYFEEYMSKGYSRHNIIFPNIVNMEFLFNDDTSDDFDFNRYVGFYVNAIELEKFKVDTERLYADRIRLNNTPMPRGNPDPNLDYDYGMHNDGGVALPHKNGSNGIDYSNLGLDKDQLYLMYVQDKDGSFHSPNSSDPFPLRNSSLDFVRLADVDANLKYFVGPDEIVLQDQGTALFEKGHSCAYIKFNSEMKNCDAIRLYHEHGSATDVDGRYDDFTFTTNYALAPNPGDFYFAENPGGNVCYVNGETYHGDTSYIASGFCKLLNSILLRSFTAYQSGSVVIIKNNRGGDYNNKYGVRFSSYESNHTALTINDKTGVDLIGSTVMFEGGTDNANRIVISVDYRKRISDNLDTYLVKTQAGWSYMTGAYYYSDEITDENFSTELGALQSTVKFFDKVVIEAEEGGKPYVKASQFIVAAEFRPSIGVFSLFDICDFDFDFYDTRYNRIPSWEIYKHFYIPKDRNILVEGRYYKVINGTISYNGVEYVADTVFQCISVSPPALSYSVVSGDPVVIYSDTDDSNVRLNDVPLYDEGGDISSFNGFFRIRDRNVIPSTTGDVYKFRDVFNYNVMRSEYDYYYENFTKDYALTSKLVPYICKWGYVDGFDARDNEYRLNSHIGMGMNNFSPNQYDITQNPINFTHEWLYLTANYPFLDNEPLMKKANYCYFDRYLTDEMVSAMEADPDLFDAYFVYTPSHGGKEISKTQYRYSTIRYNSANGSNETFFRGVKLRFKDMLPSGVIGSDGKPSYKPNSTRFDGYRFSAVLRVIPEEMEETDTYYAKPPMNMKFVCSDAGKFLLMLVDVYVGHVGQVLPSMLYPDASLTYGALNWVDGMQFYYRDSLVYEGTYGDYRLSFGTDLLGNDVSDMTYEFLYSAKNKKYNIALDNYSTIKIPQVFDMTASMSDALLAVTPLPSPYYSNYVYDINKTIVNFGAFDLLMARRIFFGNVFLNLIESGTIKPKENPLFKVSSGKLMLNELDVTSYLMAMCADDKTIVEYIPSIRFFTGYRQLHGGKSYFQNIFSMMSFANIKKYINEFVPSVSNPMIEYVNASGSAGTFYAEVVDDYGINKTAALAAIPDDVVPDIYRSSAVVGYNFVKASVFPYRLNRYSGGYEPIFKKVTRFNSTVDFEQTDMESVTNANVVMRTDDVDFCVMNNFSHLKISDNKILKLQDDNKFYPLYELIDEITIGREKFMYLSSSWDGGFHWRYDSKRRKVAVPGTFRIVEDDTYVAKVLTLPRDIDLYSFDVRKTIGGLPIDLSNDQVVYTDNNRTVDGSINVESALIDELIELGISEKFDEYLVAGEDYIGKYTIDEYVREYVKANVLSVYDVSKIVVYYKNDTDRNLFEIVTLSEEDLVQQGYMEVKDIRINNLSKYVLGFSYKKHVNYGTKLGIVLKITLI